jgi:hypothetical protein
MATKADLRKLEAKVDDLRADVDEHRAETKKGFGDLDKELTGDASLHRQIENLKGRPARTAVRAARRPRTR